MADGIDITPGSGRTVLTDDTGAGGHAQVMKLAISTDGSGTLIPAEATNGLDVDVTRVQGTVTVAGAVTNAGTFATQVDGAALTALQLIDDTVLTDDAAFTPATSKVTMVGAEFDDSSPDSVDEGDGGAVRMSATRTLTVRVRDNAGNERGLNIDGNGALAATVTNATAANLNVTEASAATSLTALQLIDDIVYTDDTSTHATGTSKGALIMGAAAPTDTAVNANDIGAVGMTVGRSLYVSVQDALPAGTAAIGKLAANSGVDIGDVDVTTVGTITPGTAATSLGKAEDAQHTTGDVGVMALGVRSDTPTALATTDADYIPLTTGARGELWVGLVRHDTRWDTGLVAVSGLTTASTTYSAGDVMGGEFTFTNAARISTGGGTLTKVVLINNSTTVGAVDLFLFDSASTPAADNAANSWSDANMQKSVGVIPLVPIAASALNQLLVWEGTSDYSCAATSLFGVLVTRSAHSFFTAATDINLRLWGDRA